MVEYTAEDGLKVLEFLGLEELTEEEIALFRQKWASCMERKHHDLVLAVDELYSQVLPFINGRGQNTDMIAYLREVNFMKAMDDKDLYTRLYSGESLEDITSESD